VSLGRDYDTQEYCADHAQLPLDFYLVETFRQPSLEAIAAIFDGDDKVEALHERTVDELAHHDEKKLEGDVDHLEHKHTTAA